MTLINDFSATKKKTYENKLSGDYTIIIKVYYFYVLFILIDQII